MDYKEIYKDYLYHGIIDLDLHQYHLIIESNCANTIPHFDLVNNSTIHHIFLYTADGVIDDSNPLSKDELKSLNKILSSKSSNQKSLWNILCEDWNKVNQSEDIENAIMPDYTKIIL